ncbi:hypothetical protein [Nocardioides sp. R-C-SC26]|uniref:hypothetical protein n=1 Tax=Nocardioides sp. R-C-SC26 TaxID=2870414 RepID=UPI001E296E3D|nr:hypothetical protein [Nocardioides sp. R-C-SC26]
MWEEELFAFLDDLEQQAVAAFDTERSAEMADRARAEYAQVALAGRLMASLDRELLVHLRGTDPVRGVLRRACASWILLRGSGHDWVVPIAAIGSLEGCSERAVPDVAWPATARLGLGSPLRGLADAGARCVVRLLDSTSVDGVPVRIGSDFLELAVEARERRVLVPFAAIAAVQSR